MTGGWGGGGGRGGGGGGACMLLVLMLFLLKDLLHDDLVIFDVGDTMSFCRFAIAYANIINMTTH